MRRILLLARSNLRREKGQTAIFLVLILIGALVLNLWLMLTTDYHANFDRWHETLHAEDVLLLAAGTEAELGDGVREILDGRSDVSEYELEEGLIVVAGIPYNGGTLTDPMIVLPADDAQRRMLGQVVITDEDASPENGLYYPLIYASDELTIGKESEVEMDGVRRAVPTAGFINSVMAGSHNCGIILLLAGEGLYRELSQQAAPGTLISVRIADPGMSQEVRGELVQALQDRWPELSVQGTDYVRNRQSRYVMQMITTAILAAAVCFELIVALTVAASNVATHVQQSMTELGILKGLGYTGTNLRAELVLQYILLSMPAALVGAALAYTVFPSLCDLMTDQTGLPYTVRFLPGPFWISTLFCTAVIAAAVWLAARRIHKVEPITALRSGMQTHSFRRNPLPLTKARLPLQAALALKNCISSPRRNTTIFITMGALTLLIVFATTMVANIMVGSEPLLDLMGVERADAMFDAVPESEERLKALLREDPRTDRFYVYSQDANLAEPDGPGLWSIVIEDGSELQNQTIVYTGRLPVYANEVAVGAKHASARGLGVGDMIEFGAGEETASYLITGLTQGTNYLGDEAYFTRAGYERLGPLTHISYLVNKKEPATAAEVDEFVADVQQEMTGELLTANNERRMKDAVLSVYLAAMEVIVYTLAVLTVILTILVMVLLTRTALNVRWREYGILKALGYSSRNLVGQTVLSFLPALVISETVGLILWSYTNNAIVSLFMRGLGTMRCDFPIPGGMIAAMGLLLLLFALAVVALMSGRIRRIDPISLMTDD